MTTARRFVTPGGHLITETERPVKRRWGVQVVGIEWCPVDSGARRRYSSEYDASRLVEVTDQVVRVSCVGCRIGAESDAALRELVARPHGPLVPSHGV